MNCSTCQNKLNKYISGHISNDVKREVEAHLKSCDRCWQVYSVNLITEQLISKEISICVNPYLSTRVMTEIESIEGTREQFSSNPVKARLKPIYITLTAVLALIIGITAGNSFNTIQSNDPIPIELVLINDASMESLDAFLIE